MSDNSTTPDPTPIFGPYLTTPSLPPKSKWVEAREQARQQPGVYIIVCRGSEAIGVWNGAKSAAGGREMRTRFKYGNGISAHRRFIGEGDDREYVGYICYIPEEEGGE